MDDVVIADVVNIMENEQENHDHNIQNIHDENDVNIMENMNKNISMTN